MGEKKKKKKIQILFKFKILFLKLKILFFETQKYFFCFSPNRVGRTPIHSILLFHIVQTSK